MARFEVNILGCGAATPTLRHAPSAQVVNVRDKLFMIDCGEGIQQMWRRMGLNINRLEHIFISHLHGDHCFGLPGLISTLSLTGRTGRLVIHAHPDFDTIFMPFLRYFCREMQFQLAFEPIYMTATDPIYADSGVTIRTIPLKHRIATCGFLFEETPGERHLKGDMMQFYDIPVTARRAIKQGAPWVTPTGEVIANERLTTPPMPPARYAYCCDTAYSERIIPYIQGVDLLYHDCTYAHAHAATAHRTFHSTAREAASIAQAAGAHRLLLGHFSARYKDENLLLQEAREIFPHTQLAREGLNIALRK